MANNPPKESMTKLGTCTITVEPHIFEASMFAIKDLTPRPPPPPVSQPMYRPIIQYGPPNGMMPPPPPPPPKQIPQPQPINQAPQRSQDTPMKDSSIPAPPPNTPRSNSTPITNGVNGTSHAQAPNANTHPPQPPPSTTNGTPATSASKSTDPVIQMLAERAATDPDLKALMRVVANGDATSDELKRFQTHIDELTRLQKARQDSQPAASQNQPPPPPPPTASVNGTVNTQPPPSTAPPTPTAKTAPTHSPAPTPQPIYQAQPQALRSKGPLPSTKPDITGVVFEFTGGTGDRYLFPKFSILEYLPGGQVIASFLIVRKGSSSDSPSYDPALDYYQPITIRLYAHQGRQLEALQKIVAPQDEVRRYMDDIMDNMTRAEYVLLAMRLPKEPEAAEAEKEKAAAERPIQMDNQVLWATTNPPPPPQVQPVKPVLSEQEQYQKFINTVKEVS
jgi:hypothetical protein